MSQIQIGFRTVISNEYFAVLDGIHGTRVDVDVWVKFLHGNFAASGFQKPSKGSSGNTLSKTGNHAAGDKHIFY